MLATAAWDLWEQFESVATRNSTALTDWWKQGSPGRAVLILDALSLREIPWILEEARNRGFVQHEACVLAAEIPADTNAFAKALGFSQRSSLENNGAGGSHHLQGAFTDCTELPWKEVAETITSQSDYVIWHRWPDHRLHHLGAPGQGLEPFLAEAEQQLRSDDFWLLIERLATGRRLVITSDHGYAASGLFPDVSDPEQAAYLKQKFKSGRFAASETEQTGWVPPVDLSLTTTHGVNTFVLGRRKWKSSGGYPTLTHGGLSVLEVAVPFVALSREEN